MGQTIDYEELYRLQDIVFVHLFKLDNVFYLTGGTALHRFTYNLRYSDDLDFFSDNDPNFHEHLEQFLYALREHEIQFTRLVSSKNFGRIIVEDCLQADFVKEERKEEGRRSLRIK